MSVRFAAKAVLFDLDGTLLDTIADLTEAANQMLAELERPALSQVHIHGFVGRGVNDLIHRCLAESAEPSAAETDAAREIFRRHYTRVNGQATQPYPGVPELLALLAARGLKMAVVTNKSAFFTLPLLQQFDLARYFGAVVCGDTLPVRKPDPAMVLYTCGLLGVKPEESLMIGDSINDSLAARAAGVPVLLVKYGYSEGMPVESIECDGLLERAEQVMDWLEGSSPTEKKRLEGSTGQVHCNSDQEVESEPIVFLRFVMHKFILLAALLLSGVAHALSLDQFSSNDAAAGLKEALTQGANKAVDLLGRENGFLGNPKVRIPLPDKLDRAGKMMRSVGMGKQVDELETTFNRAAEAAVPEAKKLLVDAIKGMSVQDAKGILVGGDNSATEYFRRTTSAPLGDKFRPIVQQAIAKVKLAEQYDRFAGSAARFGLISKEDASLDSYVTNKALDGLFMMIAEEEKAIRKDPLSAAGSLAQKVFGVLRN